MANKGKLPRFAGAQLPRLRRLVELSRDITGDHFRLGSEEVDSWPVEIRTLADLQSEEIHPSGVLADIARYQYSDRLFGRKQDLYRVNLQDHNILRVLRQDPGRLGFSPFLLYVLTHELIHIVRFVKFLVPFHTPRETRQEEEQRVHHLTQAILGKVPMRGMERVLRHYQKLAGGRE